MAEKINKNERKNKADIIIEMMGSESKEFWFNLSEEDGLQSQEQPKVSIIHRISSSMKRN